MAVITKIELQKNKSRVNIFVDDSFFCGLNKETAVIFGLKENKEIESFAAKVLKGQVEDNSSTPDPVDTEEIKKQTEAYDKLSAAIERAKSLGIDVSKFEVVDESEIKDIDAATDAINRLIEAEERVGNIGAPNKKDDVGSDDLEAYVSSFITTVSKLENYQNADPQWLVDYTDKIRKGEIDLTTALDEYKNKLSAKMDEIKAEQERNRINNEQVQLFAKEINLWYF